MLFRIFPAAAACAVSVFGAPPIFVPAPNGCAMAHCDPRISGNVALNVPTSAATKIKAHDTLPAGKAKGLGCSANGRQAACSYKDPSGNNLVVYNSDGTRAWTSGALLDSNAYASAPMINTSGHVIAADDTRVVRFTNTGSVVWNSLNPGGIPFSPVITQGGAVVLATKGGPVSAFDSVDGHLIGSMFLQPAGSGASYYDTINTPCTLGNRLYISGQLNSDPNNTGALIALDVDATNVSQPLSIAWTFAFGAPSGASPLCIGNTVYFDGGSVLPGGPKSPQIFAVRDDGAVPTLLWNQTVPAPLPAAMAQDPRSGVWAMYTNYPKIERRSTTTGALMESLNISTLVGDPSPNLPYSAINIGGTGSAPVMLLGTTDRTGASTYVIAIDLVARALLWKINLSPSLGSDSAPSQFSVVQDANKNSIVVFAGRVSGAYFVGAP